MRKGAELRPSWVSGLPRCLFSLSPSHPYSHTQLLLFQDWEECDITLFENDDDCWVVRIPLAGVDSEQGLLAYMNVLIRCNELVTKYQVQKVPEFWGTAPGDGAMYFVMRPPWVRPDRIASFYTIFPEEKDWRTTSAAISMESTRPKKESDFPAHQEGASPLRFSSRMQWGTNFLTGSASHAALGKMN